MVGKCPYPSSSASFAVVQDLEGIALTGDGTFWLCSEGSGTVDDPERPIETPNMLVQVDSSGEIVEVVILPDEVNAIQARYGFEGVSVVGSNIVVAFQREWVNETDPRIGVYNTDDGTWQFAFYPLDEPESQYDSWGRSFMMRTNLYCARRRPVLVGGPFLV
jgi:Esterase-like activity of phytase